MRFALEQPLTAEQSEKAEKNFALVHWFANKKGIPFGNHDDYFSDLVRAFMRSCMTHDESIAKFSTYAIRNLEWARNVFIKKQKRRMSKEVCSIYQDDGFVIEGSENDDQDLNFSAEEKKNLVSNLISVLSPSLQVVVIETLSGKKHTDIAKSLGLSRERVRQKYEKALLIMRKYADDKKLGIEGNRNG
jgi:RNA polymerase sigma factor (sigma-70 family)